ncbi:MAG: phosphate signaling complex protein PhoU [Lachnospiraceae bacterium]
MRNKFDEQLEQLNVELIEMGSLCEQVIAATYKALIDEDRKAAKEIIKKDIVIDRKERDIESLCLKLLLQQQPVARDLRQISAALKMITDMERLGDQAADIAEIITTTDLAAPSSSIPLGRMAEATIKMVTESIDAFVKNDLDIARNVIEYDDVVDDFFVEIREKLVETVANDPKASDYLMDLLMIAKYYERIGDHATNIAEWVVFSILGTHKGEEVD